MTFEIWFCISIPMGIFVSIGVCYRIHGEILGQSTGWPLLYFILSAIFWPIIIPILAIDLLYQYIKKN